MLDKNRGITQEDQNNKNTLDQLVKEHRDTSEKLETKKILCSSTLDDLRKDEADLLEKINKMSKSAQLTPKSREDLDDINTSLVDKSRSISKEVEDNIRSDPKSEDITRVHQESLDASLIYDLKGETLDIILADANNTQERSLEANNLKNELNDTITKASKFFESKIKYVEQEQVVKEIFEKVDKYAKDNNMTNPLISETPIAETSSNQTEVSEVSTLSSNLNKRKAETSNNQTEVSTISSNSKKIKADTLDNQTEVPTLNTNSEKRSNVEDFANPSLEMPSYIDPED